MKNHITISLFMLISCGVFSQNQIINNPDPFFRMKFNKEKRTIIEDFMDLPEEYAGQFWPIYNDYESERQRIGTARLKLLESYAEKFETLTETQVENYMQESIRLRLASNDLKEKYYKKMKKKTTPLIATQWIQAEEHLFLTIQMILFEELPFIKE